LHDEINSRQLDTILQRLEDQIAWYDRRSQSAQKKYKFSKTLVILSAAMIPLVATHGFTYSNLVTASLGVLVTVLEGILHLNQYQQLWSTYRSTCEALKHEKYIYLGNAEPYTTAKDPLALLAERIESLVSQEHAQWSSVQQQGQKASNA